MTQTLPTDEIRKGVQALFPPGSLVELRIPKSSTGTIVGYFRDLDKLVETIEAYSGNVPAVYYTLNEPAGELYDSAFVKDQTQVGLHATKDAEILKRNWLLIDCDPIRTENGEPLPDQKVSSTDAEKEASLETARQINAYLQERGWPTPISADSGNGYHLLYNMGGIASTPEVTTAVQDALKCLAEKFNTPFVQVDTSVHNPSRITKAYGSKASKGVATIDRPHRLSRIRLVGGQNSITLAQLESLKPVPKVNKAPFIIKNKGQERFATTSGPEKIEEFLDYYNIDYKAMVREAKGYKWQIVPCPFNPEHNLGEVAVFLNDDGKFGFKCFHNSCQGNHWQEFKDELQSKTGNKFFFQTNLKSAVPLEAKTTSKVSVTRASGITPEVLNWLWPNRIPFGKLTLFAGHPGVGKGMATMDIAANASRGTGWPDVANVNPPIESLIISSEDAASDTLVPRLMAANADLDKVLIYRHTQTVNGEKGFSLDTDLPALRELLEQNPDVKLVIIDPIMNHLGDLSGNSEQELRNGLTPLGKLAEKLGLAIVIVTHFNKNIAAESIQRVGGAMGMVGAVRVAWSFAEDKEDGQRKMLPMKANIAADHGGIEYNIVSVDTEINGQFISVGHIKWGNTTHSSVDSALKNDTQNKPSTKLEDAQKWLEETLADGMPHKASEVLLMAAAMAFKETTLSNAFTKMGGVKYKGEAADAPWFWQLKKA
jgi:hypothetical protein